MNAMWKSLRENNFEIVEEITNDIKCIICQNLLINAHSGPCGCLYCLECIMEYLMKRVTEDKLCPGTLNECKAKILSIDEDVVLDRSTNVKISKIYVKCSMQGCEFQDELRNIDDHLRVCCMVDIKCPYFNIGCKQSYLTNENVNNHIMEEIALHSNLLLESIDNLKNEIESLKKNDTELKLENKSIKDELETMKMEKIKDKMRIENLEANDKLNKLEIDELNQEMVSLKNENILLNDAIKQINENNDREKQESNSHIDMKTENCVEFYNQKNLLKEMNIKIDKTIQETNAWIKKTKEFNEMIRKLELDTLNIQIKLIKFESDMEKQNYGNFLWVIDNWNEKLQETKNGLITTLFSDVFYTHKFGYKMCLRAYPLGIGDGKLTHFSLFFHIMRGEFDEILPWPCKIDVTFEMFYQETGLTFNSHSTRYENKPDCSSYKKPINDRNPGIGCPKYIKLDELSNRNKLIFKCSVKLIS